MKLTTGGQSLAEVKIQRGIFQGDALSPLLFVIAMMPLNHILRKCIAGYKLSKLQEKINQCTWTTSNFLPKTKKIGNPNINCQEIGMEFGIEKCAMLVMKSGK